MSGGRDSIDRPIVVVSTPRSGSTVLYESLEQAPGLFTTGQESHWLIEDMPGLTPSERGWDSNRLTAADATPERADSISREFYRQCRDRDGNRAEGQVRLLEKTPKNALRIPFFDAIWPDCLFVYLYRDVRETLASMMEAWASGGFRTYPELPGWEGYPWSMLLVPGWRDLIGHPLPEVVAHQWARTTDIMIGDLRALPPERIRALTYAELNAEPNRTIQSLATSLDLEWDRPVSKLPLSKTTVSAPRPDKWRRLESAIDALFPIVEQADAKARAFLDRQAG